MPTDFFVVKTKKLPPSDLEDDSFLNDWPYWVRTSKLRIQSPLPYQFGEWPINHPHGDRTRNSGLRGRRLNQFDQRANYYINLH